MIHSLSGGVLADGGFYEFAKVRVGETPRWYLNGCGAAAGDRVLVPFGGGSAEGVVERTESCTAQTAPCPFKRAAEIIAVLEKPLTSGAPHDTIKKS